jgi:hypothetical protein
VKDITITIHRCNHCGEPAAVTRGTGMSVALPVLSDDERAVYRRIADDEAERERDRERLEHENATGASAT